MKAKCEGVVSVVLAVTFIFSIEYYYYSACSEYTAGDYISIEKPGDVRGIPAVQVSVHLPEATPPAIYFDKAHSAQRNFLKHRYDQCGCIH